MHRSKSFKNIHIGQFEFIVTPIRITHQVAQKLPKLCLYIQKGMQIIGKIKPNIEFCNIGNPEGYRFSVLQQNYRKAFRAYNDQNLNYHWSLYEVQDDGIENFIENSQFNLNKIWHDYVKWYENAVGQLGSQYGQKQKQKIAEKWKELKQTAEQKTVKAAVLFTKTKLLLQYQVQIKSQFDQILQGYQQEKTKKAKQKQQRIQMRSTMFPRSFLTDSENSTHNPPQDLMKTQIILRNEENNGSNGPNNFDKFSKYTHTQDTVKTNPEHKNFQHNLKVHSKHSGESSNHGSLKQQSKILSQIKQATEAFSRANSIKSKSSGKKGPLIRLESNGEKSSSKELGLDSSTKETCFSDTNQKTKTFGQFLLYILVILIMSWLIFLLMQPSRKL